MESKLFCLQDLGDIVDFPYQERYFISVPFCGLKSYLNEPLPEERKNLINSLEGSWVYGGSLQVISVIQENEKTFKTKDNFGNKSNLTLYPFSLRVSSDAFGDVVLELASSSLENRNSWVSLTLI